LLLLLLWLLSFPVVQDKVTRVENVVGFREPHVWVASGGDTVITLHVVVNARAVEQEVSGSVVGLGVALMELLQVLKRVRKILAHLDPFDITVQVERDDINT
jgi:Co/Zn/Cd efflux system component